MPIVPSVLSLLGVKFFFVFGQASSTVTFMLRKQGIDAVRQGVWELDPKPSRENTTFLPVFLYNIYTYGHRQIQDRVEWNHLPRQDRVEWP